MRTMLVLDADLVHIAQELTGVVEKSALVREGLMALIEREMLHRGVTRDRANGGRCSITVTSAHNRT